MEDMTFYHTLVHSKAIGLYVRQQGSQNDHVRGDFIPVNIKYDGDGIQPLGLGPTMAYAYGGHPVRLEISCTVKNGMEQIFRDRTGSDSKWLFNTTSRHEENIYYGLTGSFTEKCIMAAAEDGMQKVLGIITVLDLPTVVDVTMPG